MTVHQRRACAGVIAIVSILSLGLVFAQGRGAPPRTRDGRPDLQGTWSYATLTPLERPAEFAGKPFLTPAEAAAFERQTLTVQNRDRRDGEGPNGRGTDGRTDLDRAYNQGWWEYGAKVVGTRRTSLLIDPPDGLIPPLTALGQRAAEDKRGLWTANGEYEGGARGLSFDSYMDRPLQERCLGWTVTGPPMIPGAYNNNMEIFQTPDAIAIVNEMVHEHRIVPFDDRRRAWGSPIRQWMGVSRGRWEGRHPDCRHDELQAGGVPERERVASSRRALQAGGRGDAAGRVHGGRSDSTWTKPWTVQFPMTRSREPIFEVRVSRGQLQPARHPRGRPRGGTVTGVGSRSSAGL